MGNNPSAQKRVKQSEKRRIRNKSSRSAINTTVKKAFSLLEEKNTDEAKATFKIAITKLDSAANKGILNRNTVSRKISRLTKKFNQTSAEI
jgi:small subunit ribosomal protein S20